jgi:hypothetical protein
MKIAVMDDVRIRRLMAGLYVLLFFTYPVLRPERTPDAVALFLAVFFAHALVGWLAFRAWRRYLSVSLFWILFLLPRLFTSPMLPWLSDDVYSYLWHGHLTVSGQNVYAHMPLSPEYVPFRTEMFEKMGNIGVPAIYPPLSEMMMAFAVACGRVFTSSWVGALAAWKFILLLSEAVGIFFLGKIAGIFSSKSSENVKKLPVGMVLYLFTPLPAVEIVGQGHLDGLILAPLGAALLLIVQWIRREGKFPIVKSAFLGAALFLLKFAPVAIFLPLVRARIQITRAAAAALLAGVLIIACGIPFFIDPSAQQTFSQGLAIYANLISFNGIPLYLIRHLLSMLSVPLWWIVAPKILGVIRFAIILSIGFIGRVTEESVYLRRALLIYACAILLAGKVHTWYFVPLLFVNGLVGSFALVLGAEFMMLSYAAYLVVPFQEVYWLEYVIWFAFAAMLLVEWKWPAMRKKFFASFL